MTTELIRECAREMHTLKTIQENIEILPHAELYSTRVLIDEQLKRLYELAGRLTLEKVWDEIG